MTSRFDQASALVRNAQRRLVKVEEDYKKSLHDEEVSIDLQIGIKGIIDNLRSALDYVAYELAEKHGSLSAKSKVYFPIAAKGANAADFESLVSRNIPGLPVTRPDLVGILSSFQEFESCENEWLPDLATLSVENKHRNLTPQARKETKQLRIQSGSVSISMSEGISISIGNGAFIRLGEMMIPGGQVLQPGSPVQYAGSGTVENITWVSFEFTDTHKPVLPFLKKSIDGVSKIIKTIRCKI